MSIFLRDIDAHVKTFPLRWSLVEILAKYKDKPLVGAEIGVDVGNNALCMLENMHTLKHLVLIDSYARPLYEPTTVPYVVACSRLKDYMQQDRVRFLIMDSSFAAARIKDKSLDFVYVDGDHTFEGCLNDMELYWPKIKDGGCMAGHDYNMEEVKHAVAVFCDRYKVKHAFEGMDFLIHKDSTNSQESGKEKE